MTTLIMLFKGIVMPEKASTLYTYQKGDYKVQQLYKYFDQNSK